MANHQIFWGHHKDTRCSTDPETQWKWSHLADLAESHDFFMPYRNHLALLSQPVWFGFERACRTLFGIPLLIQLSWDLANHLIFFLSFYFSCFIWSVCFARILEVLSVFSEQEQHSLYLWKVLWVRQILIVDFYIQWLSWKAPVEEMRREEPDDIDSVRLINFLSCEIELAFPYNC